ncbi:MAG: spore coat protein [Eubacteriales bacterium]|nr:spore coat protein [bacterium]MDY2792056.1 spore coat protein [Eubacteriales bacterium]
MQNQTNSVMNDQDRLEDLLTEEKYLINAYSTFIPEATCPQLRQVLTTNFNDCCQNQYAVFDQMNQLGWYQTKAAPMPDIEQARRKFAQLKQQLG